MPDNKNFQPSEQQEKLMALGSKISELLDEAGIKTSVIIFENPLSTENDKIFIKCAGHKYDVCKLTHTVSTRFKNQIFSELE